MHMMIDVKDWVCFVCGRSIFPDPSSWDGSAMRLACWKSELTARVHCHRRLCYVLSGHWLHSALRRFGWRRHPWRKVEIGVKRRGSWQVTDLIPERAGQPIRVKNAPAFTEAFNSLAPMMAEEVSQKLDQVLSGTPPSIDLSSVTFDVTDSAPSEVVTFDTIDPAQPLVPSKDIFGRTRARVPGPRD